MTYSQLWPYLVYSKAIEPRPTQPKTSNFLAGYNPNVKCDFHSGVVGHSIEDRKVLKEKVQDLIDKKVLTFVDAPQVIPIPCHEQLQDTRDSPKASYQTGKLILVADSH